jgi:hypothetical protein
MRPHTRADHVIDWVEKYCLHPNGPHKGEPVRLSQAECWQVRQIYDSPSGPNQTAPLTGPLAAYLALMHTAGPEALQREFVPKVEVDIFTTWGAVSPALREVLKLEHGRIVCPKLGTKFPAAA